jgi:leucyl/phenylalanyl-tRNA--protein transferase
MRPMLPWIDDETPLPPATAALGADSGAPGLLAAGGRLTLARLEAAYRGGIFPWYGPGEPVLWWSPDPRMVLPVAQFKLHPSLRKTLRRFLRTPDCALRFDSAFEQVILACAQTPRPGQDGTWIVPELVRAYTAWHRAGRVHSAETWVDGRLVGGLYFVHLGGMVFGESMFSHRSDASKLALAALVAACRARGIALIDCQQNTAHLASLGAHEIPRQQFLAHVRAHADEASSADWTYDETHWDRLDAGLRVHGVTAAATQPVSTPPAQPERHEQPDPLDAPPSALPAREPDPPA